MKYLVSWSAFFLLGVSVIFFSCENDSSANRLPKEQEVGVSSKKGGDDAFTPDSVNGEYSVPSPNEVLSTLARIGDVDWANQATFSTKSDYASKERLALNLGIRVADALVAVNATDTRRFLQQSLSISKISSGLGVGETVDAYKENFAALAAGGDWDQLAAQLDNVQSEVQTQLELKEQQALVVLASLGGWLEGLKVISGHLAGNYRPENTDFIARPELIAYYLSELEALAPDVKRKPEILLVLEGVREISDILAGADNGLISVEEVRQVSEVSNQMILGLL